MKIFHINSHYPNGSTGRIIKNLVDYCEVASIKSFVAYREGEHIDNRDFRIISKIGIYWHIILTRIWGFQGFYSLFSTIRLVVKIKAISPDIVHLHNLHGYYLNLPILFWYLHKSKVKVVWTLHDCWAFTGGCAYYIKPRCYKWKRQCFSCPLRNEYYKSYFFDVSSMQYTLKKKLFNSISNIDIVCVSDWLKSQVEQSFLKNHNISRIYNAVNLNHFSYTSTIPEVLKSHLDKFIILGVSFYWTKEKGLDDMIELSKLLNEDEVIVLVGDNSNACDLPDNIISVPLTNDVKELASFFSSADLYFNPSIAETFGLVTAEALACGTPCVVYDNTASPEIVDNTCGFVVETGDVEAVYKIVRQVELEGKRKWDTAYLRVLNNFTEEKVYSLYVELYKNICHR